MLSAALLLLSNSLFLSLRLTGNPGTIWLYPDDSGLPAPQAAERACLERWAQGDLEARNRLVEHNLRLVAHIIKKYYTQADNQEDLISIGTIGLIKAVNTFRADRGIKLATYASRCIENEILMYFRSQRKLQGEVSLSDAIDTDKEGGSLYLLDVVGTDDTMLSDLQDREEQLLLRRLVRDCLTEREADIIRRRYGLEGHPPQTQRQVAAVYGISRSYVSRIEKRALEKLEKELRKG
jgi:RNA polymerase sporulation-specific sigma factor